MSDIVGRSCDLDADADADGVRARLSELFDAIPVDTEGTVSLLVDAHYPFHPSTGLVTNPLVTEAAIEVLQDRGASVTLWCPSGGQFTSQQCVSYLGYDGVLDRTGVDLVDPDLVETVTRTVAVGSETVELSLAAPLVSETVVAVPTLRREGSGATTTGVELTARSALGHEPTTDEIAAVAAACPPDVTVLDGTYAFAGRPCSPRVLLAGAEAPAVDRVAVWLVGGAIEETYLDAWGVESEPPTVDGVDLTALRETIEQPGDDTFTKPPSRAVEYGYRLYTRVSGDLVPPQFLPESDK